MSSYVYNASALGAGGVLTSGNGRTVIPSLASVALSPTGGEGFSTADDYNANGIAFSHAESRVVGAEVGSGIFTTYSEVFITNFTAFDRFSIPRLRIAMMSAQVTSTRNLNLEESHFEVRTTFHGVNVDGVDVEPVLDIELCKAKTFGEVVQRISGDISTFAELSNVSEEKLRKVLSEPNSPNPLTGTLVRDYREQPVGKLERRGAALIVPHVGVAHLAEFIFKPGRRRVNLLRLDINDSDRQFAFSANAAPSTEAADRRPRGGGGFLAVGSVEGNGSPPIP